MSAGCSTKTYWKEVDAALQRIAFQRGALDVVEAKWLREANRVKIWREVGCVSLLDYVERRLGYAPRTARDRIRVAHALAELPAIETALGSGLPFSAARELSRVATAETEQSWLDSCRGKSVHEIERAVAGRKRGALPARRASTPDRGPGRSAIHSPSSVRGSRPAVCTTVPRRAAQSDRSPGRSAKQRAPARRPRWADDVRTLGGDWLDERRARWPPMSSAARTR